MKLFITKKKLVKKMAQELAYLQIRADWWYYCYPNEKVGDSTKQDMASSHLDSVTELRCICKELGIIDEVYEEAYKIYDFRRSGKEDFVPNIELIKKMNKEFCEPMKKRRPII